MDTLEILRNLAIIVISAKLFGLIARKLKAPQVAGEIIAGLLIGPSLFNIVVDNDFWSGMAEIGVILLMFSAGLETNIDNLKKSGLKATAIAIAGVSFPLVLGTIMYMCFYGFSAPGTSTFVEAVFIGTILTATSVSITVSALKELGKISTDVGTTIMSAAIIDDVIGIVVLTAVLGLKDPNADLGAVCIKTVAFFALSLIAGVIIFKIMQRFVRRWPHTRRIPIIGMALAFVLAYVADKYFGVADITGAYVAGIILSSLDDSAYIDRKMDISSYMIFGPIFFASVGLQTNLRTVDLSILAFSMAFVLAGLLGKVIGCGLVAKLLKYNNSDALKIGVGMMTRGEVALIVAQRGLKAEIIDSKYFTSVILLIVVSSILTPIILKAIYSVDEKNNNLT
ncbi:Kef-type K+ transport system, membrane component KefB [Butyrivibrio hungatei DSM 14810]|uniref:Kef-type K+ transport system, membrane component KefB n=1 Tax=Butyrivibrio hungatei DSM 14810 TaxID=1121132 RepID=A0A1M7T310_9FIRM|nr:cation:proton antiporter [Butyrivibrio hungatei]SHN65052.1 Kef-type K+ transport system, membrane component KefB [Butyrivibrio hungatei DSM 14810]